MEGRLGQNSVPPSTSFDKSKILDVKPLRSLVPVFPTSPQAPPFVCAPPFGPFPSGFSPFYPFSGSQTSSDYNGPSGTTPTGPFPAPIRSFRRPPPEFAGASNDETASSMEGLNEDGFSEGKKRALRGSSSSQKKTRRSRNTELSLSGFKGKGFDASALVGIGDLQREDGDRDIVNCVLMTFDALRRRLSQLEDAKESTTGIIKRADLKAGNILMSKGIRTNTRRRIGVVPGVEIGDIFFFRMELCVVGLHAQSMGGIDYMITRGDFEEEPVALSIVSSGGYDDDTDDSDILIYSGQGGNFNKKDMQVADQKLERGNLALERSLRRNNEVRVIRGLSYSPNSNVKVYVYDGLFRIQESWTERGKSGANIFKYKLVRVPGQPSAFALWKSVQRWKEGFPSRVGLVLPDLTSGAESIPVTLVNDVDDEKGPAYFSYFPTVKYSKSFSLTRPSYGCNCQNACSPGDLNCSCIRRNEGDFPYTGNGILVSRRPMVHECGPTCPCFPKCKNRVSQSGIKLHLEVFKTKDRGWALRSLDPIRAGTFICEYAGEVIDKLRVSETREEVQNDEYVFDTTRVYDSFKWNYEAGLVEGESSSDCYEDYAIQDPLIISAKNFGNVARFMNHSCSPNVFWQPTIYEQNDQSFVHIAFFALRHIPPMTELTYDYGIAQSAQAESKNPLNGKRKCLCGSLKCRGSFG
ncbi:histone-lysine N-methyltransferase, H3 lysine-9 specific SUVH1-like [Quillaja saponaria]|uniref:Histone-lysine N-methyltransferase, H3 lysine-9 specific SUVH1-like n=1 Tax=Quillaja saponaria TaxID=32244 RepID=A0AAD7PBU7_QUISA|nr:histone-lysine N-methyltransferase, H3 lysine-9 specific SUVH1-like [Quillaja saponaria]